MKKLVFLIVLGIGNCCFAQDIDVEGEIEATAVFSSEDSIPFWFYTNSNTTIGPETNFAGLGSVSLEYKLGEATLEGGSAWFYRDGIEDEFQRRDLYVRFKNNWLKITLGSKQQDEAVSGLSATNKNFLWSSNARPLPGLIIEASEPLRISDVFGLDWGIGHYQLNDDRWVSDINVHYKRLGVVITFNERNKLTARIQHFAMWGGKSPMFGQLREDFDALVSVFFASRASETGSDAVVNRVGNHLGTYFVEYELTAPIGEFSFYHEHPFEDGSGTRLANFPDGIWGVQFSPEDTRIIDSVLYEYIDTSDQSGTNPGGGLDGYFGNNVYRSGWSYEGNVIGLPFIIFDKGIELTDVNSPYTSNRAKIHHFGVSGTFKKIQWKLKSTYATHLGTYRKPFSPSLKNWHNFASFSYQTEKYGVFSLLAGADFSNIGDDVYAGGLQYRYTF